MKGLIEITKELAQRIVDLCEDPHPGLSTWQSALVRAENDLHGLFSERMEKS